ncbi:unnamed protein product [Pieris brassicae]|uniref:Uncharacterized protein n=1 Tax=Pieris brassicae TaxID=7116 RepID=A0A9P0XAK6_PIEBR|nr:unnamed protein product [Pieris brassicae]
MRSISKHADASVTLLQPHDIEIGGQSWVNFSWSKGKNSIIRRNVPKAGLGRDLCVTLNTQWIRPIIKVMYHYLYIITEWGKSNLCTEDVVISSAT